MIAQLNTFAELWWQWMGSMFWQVSLLVILVLAIDKVIQRWAWPQVRYVLLGLVFIKLVIPPTWQMPTSIVSWIQPLVEKRISIQIDPQDKITGISLEMDTDADAPALNSTNASGLSGRISLWSILFLTWMVGMVAFGVVLGRKIIQLHRWHRHQKAQKDSGRIVPDWFRVLLTETATRLNLRKNPEIVFSIDVVNPAVYGLLRPVLLLPEDFFTKLSREETEHVLIHELCHLKRGDLWVHWFCLVLQMVYWFNPLLIWTRRKMRYVCEICCDLSVADILREKTRFYRDTLVRTAKELFTETVEPGLGLLGVFEEPFRIVPRLQWLEKKTWENRKRKSASILFTSLIMVIFVMPMAGTSQSNAQNEAFSVQNDPQLKFSSDGTRWDLYSRTIYLAGKVKIILESMTLAADNVTIRTKKNFEIGQRLTPDSVTNLEANGNVIIGLEDGTSTSDKAVYDVESNKLFLSGRAKFTMDYNTISGEIVEIDLEVGKVVVSQALAELPADEVYDLAGIDEPPRPIRVFPPKYPLVAKEEKIEGRIVVELVVTKDGTPRDEWVIDAAPPDIFEEAALEAVRRYQFVPGKRNGEAVDVRVKLPINFILEEPDEDFQIDPEAKDRAGIKYETSEVDRPPRVLRVFPPKYPLIAKEEKIEGKVMVRFVVDTDGSAQEPEVVMAAPYGIFEESTLEVIELYQFEPAVMNGMPVNCIVQMPIVYAMDIEKSNQAASLPEEISSFNFNNAGIRLFIKFVGDMTGRPFTIDDDVIGKVTLLSEESMSIGELNRLFESVLDKNGFEAVPSGESTRIKKKDL